MKEVTTPQILQIVKDNKEILQKFYANKLNRLILEIHKLLNLTQEDTDNPTISMPITKIEFIFKSHSTK